jgi:hypothetical protein
MVDFSIIIKIDSVQTQIHCSAVHMHDTAYTLLSLLQMFSLCAFNVSTLSS